MRRSTVPILPLPLSVPCSSLLHLTVSEEKKSFITFSIGQLNFNLPSIFSRLSKTAQNVAVAPKLEPLQEVVPTVASCTDNDTHFELITGAYNFIIGHIYSDIFNRTAHIRQQCRKATVFSCHRCLINMGVEKMNNI